MNILIIGYGVVGNNLANELYELHPDIYDKYKTDCNTKRDIKYDIAFICVDTPYTAGAPCDISAVEAALNENRANIFVIKSTVLPGTTESLNYKYPNKNIIFSPEYYGGTQHCNNFTFDFTILGGNKETCCKVIQCLQDVYDARHQFRITDSTTAELTKYMENSWLATKVTFCTQFFELAKKLRVNYEELRELFLLDERVNPAHTFVYADHPYWSSHCLNKDVPAIAEEHNATFLQDVIDFNNRQRLYYERKK